MNKKVKGHSDLIKTPEGAVVNENETEYKKYLKNKEKQQKKDQEVEILKKDIEELKNLIKELLDK